MKNFCYFFCFLAMPLFAQTIEPFNGKDFSNWTFGVQNDSYDPLKVWKIENDSTIHVMGVGYEQSGLRTNETYGNYELTLEYSWLSTGGGGNSGIWIHGKEGWQRAGGAFPASIEVQLRKGYAGDLLHKGVQIDAVEGHISEGERVGRWNEGQIVEHKDGNWNTIRVRCEGSTIEVWLNDLYVNKGMNCSKSSGYITLQAERWNIAFRNIKITSIDKTHTQAVKQKEQIKVFPNPAQNYVEFHPPIERGAVKVFNVSGQLVFHDFVVGKLHIGHWKAGNYFLVFNDQQVVFSKW